MGPLWNLSMNLLQQQAEQLAVVEIGLGEWASMLKGPRMPTFLATKPHHRHAHG